MELLYPFLGEAMGFSKTDQKWEARRKVFSTAFYKDKLIEMIDTCKLVIESKFK